MTDAPSRVVALDGPSGSGKSTVARELARRLGWRYVDTGATYRAATLAVLRAGTDLTDERGIAAVVASAEVSVSPDPDAPGVVLDGEDVSDEVRGAAVTSAVSAVSAVPAVRQQLVDLQRELAGEAAVLEGRDIGTAVFPAAAVKVFLDASPEVRAGRRAGDADAGVSDGDGDVLARVAAGPRPPRRAGQLPGDEPARRRRGRRPPRQQRAGRRAGRRPGARARARGGPGPVTTAVAAPRRRATGTVKPPVVTGVRLAGTALARTVLSLRVEGAEHVPATGPVLLAGNHSGILDGPLVFFVSPRPATLLTKSEVFVGFWARACGWLGLIPVHRGAPDRAALRAGLAHLRSGGALGVFPEGTRGSGQFDTVADGLAYLALRSGAAVVPIAVHGTGAALPRGRKVPRLRAPVRVVFGPPVPVDVPGDPRARATVRAAAEQLREGLVAHLSRTDPKAPR